MVLLGGLELVAAGYLLNRHIKNKEEKQRLEIEALNLEEQSYHIYSADDAGPRRRRHSHDRVRDRSRSRDRVKDRRHRRKESPDRQRDKDRKYSSGGRDRERSRDRGDRRKSREDVRYTSPPYPSGAPSNSWVPPPPPPQQQQQRQYAAVNAPRFTQPQYAPASHHSPSPHVYPPPPPPPQPYVHPAFANEPYRYPPEKLPESLLTPPPSRTRSSSAPGGVYQRPRANTSRVRIAVPGEDELTIPGEGSEMGDAPPAYEELGHEYRRY